MMDIAHLRHSLRTPLNHIIGYSEMLVEDASDQDRPEAIEALREIQAASQELLQAIQRNLSAVHEPVSSHLWRSLRREASEPVHRILATASNLIERDGFDGPDMLRISSAAHALSDMLEAPQMPPLESIAPGQAPDFAPQHARLLIVDDDENNRDVLCRQLERLGYEAISADGGRRALQVLAESAFDVVLLDIIMPGMDGFQVLAEMKADARLKHVPVIVISALDEMQSVSRCIEMGADDFISKPFDRVILKSRISALIKRRETERERAQIAERFRSLLESTGEGIFGIDREGKCTFINAAAVGLLGSTREELLGSVIHDALHPQHTGDSPFPAHQCPMNRAARSGETSRILDDQFTSADGATFPVDYSASPIIRDGQIEGAVITFANITERKRTEEKFRETAKLESLGVLAGGIAHDFNNLLTGILGNASLVLESEELAPADREKLEYVVTASERAADLTSQMLAYAGKGRYQTRAVDISTLVTETRTLFSTMVPKTVNIELLLDKDIPAIEADPIQITQVIMNLVINGGEAIGEPNPGTVTVRTFERHVDPQKVRMSAGQDLVEGNYVVLEVKDTGKGMTPEVQARIFDPFYTTKFTGRGLGLAAVLGIVKSHRGAIQVESTVGKGSCFRVFLPASTQPAAVYQPRVLRRLSGTGRILVVDDEAVVRQTTEAVLRFRGFETLAVAGGDDAVKLFASRSGEISLILLDMMMPGMSGDEAFSRLRAIRPDIPIVVSSGYSEAQVMQYFTGRDVSAFIQKPYSSSALIEVIQSTLSGKSAALQDQ